VVWEGQEPQFLTGGNKRGNPPKFTKRTNSRPKDLNAESSGRSLLKVNKIQKSQSVNSMLSCTIKSSF
jgi:hypothetical protein